MPSDIRLKINVVCQCAVLMHGSISISLWIDTAFTPSNAPCFAPFKSHAPPFFDPASTTLFPLLEDGS